MEYGFESLLQNQASTAIVFVHGILSDGQGCWKHANGTYWPKLLFEDETFVDHGIYVFEYETSFFSGTYNLDNVVDR